MYRHTFALLAMMLLTACSNDNDQETLFEVAPSSLSIAPVAIPEGAPGELKQLTFRVTMTEPQPTPVSIRYKTVARSATEGEDYLQTSGEISITAGALEGFIGVDVMGDDVLELAETFALNFTTSANAAATHDTAIGTVANDDAACNTPFNKNPNPWLVGNADPLNFAHRGGVIDFPENTLYAYGEVAIAGADVLEMDVYQTADDELVILHDLDVDRTTNGSGNVVDLTLAELRALDAAYWFVPGEGTPHDRPSENYVLRGIATGDKPPPPGYSAQDFKIPTLEEALQRFAGNRINLELKPDLDGRGNYEQQMADLLQAYGRYTDVIAASFVDQAANNFKAVMPCVFTSVPLDQGTAIVLAAQGDAPMQSVPEHVAFQVPPDTSQISQIPEDFFLEVVTPDFIKDAHDVNLAVQVWTINSCEDMLRMIELGVDGIMTDRPLLLEELLNTAPEDRRC